MKKKTKTIIGIIVGLVFIACMCALKYYGYVSSRIGAAGSYSDSGSPYTWDISLRSFNGTLKKPLFSETGFIKFTSQADSGLITVTVENDKQVVCKETISGSDTLIIPVWGRTIVSVKAEDFTGSVNAAANVTETVTSGNIYLYGEAHADEDILDYEFETWKEYYDSGMRDLFIEDPYYTAQFMNLWMKASDDTIFDEIYADWEGSQAYSQVVRDFYFRIKRECPETVFHGIDVGHQYDTTGARYLKYLADNGFSETSEEYILASVCIEQGKVFYNDDDYAYRETQMAYNFVREYQTMNGKPIMGIFGTTHTELGGMNYGSGKVPSLGNYLARIYGDVVSNTNLVELVRLQSAEVVSTETITLYGKEYTASYYGSMDLSAVLPEYQSRDVWRIEDAYEDFKDVPTTGNVLPYDNYPMNIEAGQVFKIVYTKKDGTVIVEYHRCDGMEWLGKLSTEQMDLQ